MSHAIQAVRGMNDLLPDQLTRWRRLESAARHALAAYGYREIRFPLVEKTELFARSIGDVTDIVEKEMYSFEDKSGERLTLRPEGTAGCVRAGIEHGLLHNQVQRLWYLGPMFRHERPQKGRYRQFHQIGVEAFGLAAPELDAELILLSARLWRALNLSGLTLEINSLGSPAARAAYREKLVTYFRAHVDRLDADSLRRLEKNPLRILDSKNPALAEVVSKAPNLQENLDEESRAHFARVLAVLDAQGVVYRINPRLVRGLDYYTRTVFEWTTDRLGSQSAVCAGGRYDGLVEHLGGRATPAAGFAFGLERLVELLELQNDPGESEPVDVYLLAHEAGTLPETLLLAEKLRDLSLRVETDVSLGSLKSQLKRADKSGAAVAAWLEAPAGRAVIKSLRSDAAQQTLEQGELMGALALTFSKKI